MGHHVATCRSCEALSRSLKCLPIEIEEVNRGKVAGQLLWIQVGAVACAQNRDVRAATHVCEQGH
jgi:hypothetical protein